MTEPREAGLELLVRYIAVSLGEYAHKPDCELLIEPDSDDVECDCELVADLADIFHSDKVVRAALATPSPGAGREGLDVERLAEAIEAEWYNGNMGEGTRDRLLAAARLSAPTDGWSGLSIGEPDMHRHDGLGSHRAETHHRWEDYQE